MYMNNNYGIIYVASLGQFNINVISSFMMLPLDKGVVLLISPIGSRENEDI